MKVMIVGGGKSASNLIKLMQLHEVDELQISLIDTDMESCQEIADTFEIEVYLGDGCNRAVLEHAGIRQAEIFLALTGQDEKNLVACQLAKNEFGISNPICRVNEPKNIPVIKKLGISNTFSSTMLLAKVLNQEVEHSGINIVHSVAGTNKAIIELVLRADADVVGKTLKEIDLPGESRVVLVTHRPQNQIEIPTGDTVLQAYDRLMLIADRKRFDILRTQLAVQGVALVENEEEEELQI